MIVNKPQFDTETLKQGQAYWLTSKDHRGYLTINAPCIVTAVKPLTLVVTFWSDRGSEKRMKELTMDINSVVDGTFKFEPMSITKLTLEGK